MPPSLPTTSTQRRWVWRSTDASIAAGQISLLALLEIPLAMALFGSLAYYSPWPWLSLFGCMAAPILLLRSPSSIRRGKAMLWWYVRKEQVFKRTTVLLLVVT